MIELFKKQKKTSPIKSTGEEISLADIRGNKLYTKDGNEWMYLKVQPIPTALMTTDEKERLTLTMTRELSPINVPFKIIFLTRPTDVKQQIDYYEGIKAETIHPLKRESLTQTIRFFSQASTSHNVLERQTFISISSADIEMGELLTVAQSFEKALFSCGIRANICDEKEIIGMVGLFFSPSFSSSYYVDTTPNIPLLRLGGSGTNE